MTALKSRDGLIVRPARAEDAPTLRAFRCSSGSDFEAEVERFIRDDALRWALAPQSLYRLLVVIEDKRLIGCFAHHPEALVRKDGAILMATRLQVLALSLADQGRRLDKGQRLSDAVMDTLIVDALTTRDSHVLSAIVARENVRSMALCERHGLRSQIRHDSRHVRLSGHFARRG